MKWKVGLCKRKSASVDLVFSTEISMKPTHPEKYNKTQGEKPLYPTIYIHGLRKLAIYIYIYNIHRHIYIYS